MKKKTNVLFIAAILKSKKYLIFCNIEKNNFIQNFEFNVNETGGFDCKTDLISLGVSTVQKMESNPQEKG